MRQIATMAIAAVLLAGCEKHSADAQPGTVGQPGSTGVINPQLADATNQFGFNLLAKLNDTSDVMISPASVAIALAMTHNGADGETQKQMAATLKVSGMTLDELNAAHKELRAVLTDSDSDVTMRIANSLWARQGYNFDTSFVARNTTNFGATVTALDFSSPESPATINGWVSDNTAQKIPSIVESIDPATILFLINAIYFKGTWTYTFDSSKTYKGVFHHPSGAQQRRLMVQENDFAYLKADNFQAVRLPYGKSERFAMYVFLPAKESSISAFAGMLTAAKWKDWTGAFGTMKGSVHLPRFTITYDKSLGDMLQSIGMTDAFDPGRANFSKMINVPGENVFISEVKHKTFMEVNEEGTEAAAVTSVGVVVTSFPGPEDYFEMIVDRPFFCAIADKESGLILFMGNVSEFE